MAARDFYEKDFYAVLGVDKRADSATIKKQYRKLARELHPDKTKGDKKLEERFKAVSEAYDVLGDDKKRAEYDEARDAYTSGRIPPGGFGSGNFNAGDFSEMFGGDIFSSLFGGQRGPRRGTDLQMQTTISFRDSIFGKQINVPLNPPGSAPTSIEARIPAGVQDGNRIKLKGRGALGQAGPGDLYITVNVVPHPIFSRQGNDLLITVPVTFTEAALGADISVPTLTDESVKVRLTPGTPSGRILRVKGRGVHHGNKTGDLLVKIEVQVPQRVDGKARQALEEFAEATKDFDPRQDLVTKARA